MTMAAMVIPHQRMADAVISGFDRPVVLRMLRFSHRRVKRLDVIQTARFGLVLARPTAQQR